MHTKDFLAQELRSAGLDDMAEKAATGWYHDFMSPLDTPATQLVNDLADAALHFPERRDPIIELRRRAINGEFDASTEESDDWAESPEGQETFGRLIEKR